MIRNPYAVLRVARAQRAAARPHPVAVSNLIASMDRLSVERSHEPLTSYRLHSRAQWRRLRRALVLTSALIVSAAIVLESLL